MSSAENSDDEVEKDVDDHLDGGDDDDHGDIQRNSDVDEGSNNDEEKIFREKSQSDEEEEQEDNDDDDDDDDEGSRQQYHSGGNNWGDGDDEVDDDNNNEKNDDDKIVAEKFSFVMAKLENGPLDDVDSLEWLESIDLDHHREQLQKLLQHDNMSLEVFQAIAQSFVAFVDTWSIPFSYPVFVALEYGVSYKIVKELLDHWNTEEDEDSIAEALANKSLLITALEHNNHSLPLLELLTERFPKEVNIEGIDGRCPLHVALSQQCPPEVIKFLVDRFPGAVQKKDIDGNLPLHIATRQCGYSKELVEYLVGTYESGVKELNDMEYSPLHCAVAVHSNNVEVVSYLLSLLDEDTKLEKFPLHIALQNRCSSEIIDELLIKEPNSIRWKNDQDEYPLQIATRYSYSFVTLKKLFFDGIFYDGQAKKSLLHLALKHDSQVEWIQFLLESYPSLVNFENQHGDLPLHVAAKMGLPLSIVQLLCREDTELFLSANEDGNTPLHLALSATASLEVIQILCGTEPKMVVSHVNNKGQTALHIAAANKCSVEIVKYLMEAAQDCVELLQHDGQSFLHVALASCFPFEIIDKILAMFPGAIRIRSDTNQLPLHVAAGADLSLETVNLILEKHKEAAKEPDRHGNFPLHLAIMGGAKKEIVDLLLSCYSQAASHKNKDGRLPLHVGFEIKGTIDPNIPSLLLEAFPYGVSEQDFDGNLPIHCLLSSKCKNEVELVELLSDGTLRYRNKRGELPLHVALRCNADEEVISYLKNDFGSSVIVADINGDFPIHVAVANGASQSVIESLLDDFQEAVKLRNKAGKLPLHMAIQHGASLQVIEHLLGVYGEAIEEQDGFGNLPFHLAMNQGRIQVAKLLYKAHPRAASHKNISGQLPLHVACSSQSQPVRLINELLLLSDDNEVLLEPDNDGNCPLHLVGKFGLPKKLARNLIHFRPEVLRFKNNRGELPLHLYVGANATPDLVNIFIKHYKDSAKESNDEGNFPIHFAVENKAPMVVVKLLHAAYPAAIENKNNLGQLPIHLAVLNHANREVISYLVEKYCGCLEESDPDGNFPFHLFLKCGTSFDVFDILSRSRDPNIMFHKNNDGQFASHLCYLGNLPDQNMKKLDILVDDSAVIEDEYGNYSLHIALSHGCSYYMIQQIVDFRETALFKKTNEGLLPLHLAVAHSTSYGVLKRLMNAYRDRHDVTKIPTKDGNLPLHLACVNGFNFEIIKMILESYEEGARQKNLNNQLPIHLAVMNSTTSVVVLALLLDKFPDTVMETDHANNSLLHLAVKHRVSDEVVEFLLGKYPVAVDMKNSEHLLPIQVAVMQNCSKKVLDMLLQKSRDSELCIDRRSNALLHLAVQQSSFHLVETVLQLNRSALRMANLDGQLPLHIALVYNAPEKVVELLMNETGTSIDNNSNSLFHLSLGHTGLSIETLGMLWENNEEAARMKDRNENFPLHLIIASSLPKELIEAMIEVAADTAKSANIDGDYPFHLAVKHLRGLDILELLFDAFPDAVQCKNKQGYLPLHLCITAKAPKQVIEFIIDKFEEGLYEVADNGDYPLHMALRAGSTLDVIEHLLNCSKDVLTKKNRFGETPLHIAASTRSSRAVMSLMIDQFSNVVPERDVMGNFPLHNAILSQAQFSTVEMLLEWNKEQAQWKNGIGELPLHIAIAQRASKRVVKLLLSEHPDAVKERDENGNYPLHLATKNRVSNDVMDMLFRSYPEAVRLKNIDNDYPLHIAVAKKASKDVVKLLLNEHKEAVKEKNRQGNYPLHLSLMDDPLPEIVELLFYACSDIVRQRNSRGEWPLHIAVINRSSVDIVYMLLDEYVDAVREKDNSGQYLLNIAIKMHCSLEVMQALLWAYTDVVTEPDEKNQQVTLHLSAIYNCPATLVEAILDEYPSAVGLQDANGSYPVHLAVQHNASLDVLNMLVEADDEFLGRVDNNGELALHIAIKNNASLEVVKILVDGNTDSVKEKDKAGNYPLHLAVSNNCSMECTELILRKFPEIIKEKDSDGKLPFLRALENGDEKTVRMMIALFYDDLDFKNNEKSVNLLGDRLSDDNDFPLHIALSNQLSTELIEVFLNKSPSAVLKEHGKHHWLPLHVGISNSADASVIDHLITLHKDAVKAKDSEGRLPLHIAIQKGISDEIIQKHIVKEDFNILTERFGNEESSLHLAIHSKSSETLVGWLVDKLPDATFKEKSHGGFLLHESIRCDFSVEIVKKILLKYPDAAGKYDSNEFLPIHIALERKSSKDVIKLLASHFPDALKTKFPGSKNIPIHVALQADYPLDLITELVELNPQSLEFSGEDDRYPLHVAILYSKGDVINYILSEKPEITKMPDKLKQLPLHLSIEKSLSVDIIETIFAINRDAILTKNSDNDLPLHLAIKNKVKDTISAILYAWPHGVREVGCNGYLPLHLAVVFGLSDELMKPLIVMDALIALCGDKDSVVEAKDHGIEENVIDFVSQTAFTGGNNFATMGIALPMRLPAVDDDCEKYILAKTSSPSTLLVRDHDKKIPLHLAIEKPDAKKYPILLELLSNADTLVARFPNDDLPLHFALKADLPEAIIVHMVNLCPAAVKEKGMDGQHALHIAAVKSGANVITNILNEYKDAALIKHKDKLPIHSVLERQQTTLEVVEQLTSAHVGSLTERYQNNNLPIHAAIKAGCSENVITFLIDKCPDSAKQQGFNNFLPLHLSLQQKSIASASNTSIVGKLVEIFPNSVQIRDKNNKLPLHIALENQASKEVIELLISFFKDSLGKRMINGDLPLHFLLNKSDGIKKELVLNFLKAFPQAAKVEGADGYLPLQLALTQKAHKEIISKLIVEYPDAVKINDKDSKLPLQVALEKKHSTDVVLLLIKSYPASLKEPFLNNDLPLHFSIKLKTDTITFLLLENELSVANLTGNNNYLPLHTSIIQGSSLAVVEKLIAANRDALKCGDKDSLLPLHLALKSGASKEIIDLLLEESPKSLFERYPDNDLPLHKAISMGLAENLILKFIEKCPESVKVKGNNNYLPLHVAIMQETSTAVISELLSLYSDGASIKDKDSKLPLQTALEKRVSQDIIILLLKNSSLTERFTGNDFPLHCALWYKLPPEVILMILERSPESARFKGSGNYYPLHIAVKTGYSSSVIDRLLQCNEDALREPFPNYDLPLHEALSKKTKGDFISKFLDRYPDGAKHLGFNNSLPLHVAIRHEATIDVIEKLCSLFPEGRRVRDKDSKLPLHLAVEVKSKFEVIDLLLKNDSQDTLLEPFPNNDLPIHQALMNRSKEAIINLMVERCKEALQISGNNNYLPLHVAIIEKSPKDVVLKLTEKYVGAVNRKDKDSKLPLHSAIEKYAAQEVIEVLLKQNPESCLVRYPDNDLPLHKALSNQLSDGIILTIIKYSSVTEKGCNNYLPIHVASIFHASESVMSALVNKYPDAVKIRDKDRKLAIHTCLELKAPKTIIELLVNTNKDTLREKDSYGRLPLHIAVRQEASEEVLDILINAYPDATKSKDNLGRLPLHWALLQTLPKDSVVRKVMNDDYDLARLKSIDGLLPLHIALSNSVSDEIVEVLVRAYPESVRERKTDGSLPLHVALVQNASNRIIELFMKEYPKGASKHDANNRYPLHLALRNNVAPAIVLKLLEAYPDVAKIKDDQGNTPLLLAINAETPSAEVIKMLIALHVEATRQSDSFNNWPLHVALQKGLSPYIIQLIMEGYPPAIQECDVSDRQLPIEKVLNKTSPNLVLAKEMIACELKGCNNDKLLSLAFVVDPKNTVLAPEIKVDIVNSICNDYSHKLKDIITARDASNRTIINIADEQVKQTLYDKYLFCGRFQLLDGPPLHCSATSMVILALDMQPDQFYKQIYYNALDRSSEQPGSVVQGMDKNEFKIAVVLAEIFEREADFVENDKVEYLKPDERKVTNFPSDDKKGTIKGENWIPVTIKSKVPGFNAYNIEMIDSTTAEPIIVPKVPIKYLRTRTQALIERDFLLADRSNDDFISYDEFLAYCKSKLGESRKVVLKMMKYEDQYEREKKMREALNTNGDNQYVLGLLDGPDQVRLDRDLQRGREIDGRSIKDYKYCLVMSAADRNLDEIYRHERPDVKRVKTYMEEVGNCLYFLHEAGLIHGDLKMLNVVRIGGKIRLIDLDAAAKTWSHMKRGGYAGAKFSSGILPPEMFSLLNTEQKLSYEDYWKVIRKQDPELWKKIRPRKTKQPNEWVVLKTFAVLELKADRNLPRDQEQLPYKLQNASVAIDMWSFGVMLFTMLTRRTMLLVDGDDDLVDMVQTDNYNMAASPMECALRWTDDLIDQMLMLVDDVDAYDLLSKLLTVDPKQRLRYFGSMKKVLEHDFFKADNKGANQAIMKGLNSLSHKIDRMSEDLNKQIKKTEAVLLKGILEVEDVSCPSCFVILNSKLTQKELQELLSAELTEANCTDEYSEEIRAASEVSVTPALLSHTSNLSSWFEKFVDFSEKVADVATQAVALKDDMRQNSITMVKGAVDTLFHNEDKLFLYLVDEVTMRPILPPEDDKEGNDIYPIAIETHNDTVKKLAPFMKIALKGLKVVNAGTILARCLGYPFPTIPRDIMQKLDHAVGTLDEKTSLAEYHYLQNSVLSSTDDLKKIDDNGSPSKQSSSSPNKVPMKSTKLHDISLRQLDAFFATRDPKRNFCGLQRYFTADGELIWTTPENMGELEEQRKLDAGSSSPSKSFKLSIKNPDFSGNAAEQSKGLSERPTTPAPQHYVHYFTTKIIEEIHRDRLMLACVENSVDEDHKREAFESKRFDFNVAMDVIRELAEIIFSRSRHNIARHESSKLQLLPKNGSDDKVKLRKALKADDLQFPMDGFVSGIQILKVMDSIVAQYEFSDKQITLSETILVDELEFILTVEQKKRNINQPRLKAQRQLKASSSLDALRPNEDGGNSAMHGSSSLDRLMFNDS